MGMAIDKTPAPVMVTRTRIGTRGFDSAGAVEHLRASDKVLAKTIDRVGNFRFVLQRTPSTFGALSGSKTLSLSLSLSQGPGAEDLGRNVLDVPPRPP
jgi:hypothetical protein